MNARSHRTKFSKRLGQLVVVGEHAKSQGKTAGARHACSGATRMPVLMALACLCLSTHRVWAQPAPGTLPTGGKVAAGSASISSNAAAMTIRQASDRAIINWHSFNVGKDASVAIQQPTSQSVLLNRVTGESPTQIFGQLSANGQVVLVNPNGITLGKDGSVSGAGFTASTLGISDANFMAGNMHFERNGSAASVVNQGRISTQGGYVALLGASVSNEGRIETRGGAALLGAADAIHIPLSSSGRVKLELSPAQINASVANTQDGVIVTEGGQLYMQAAALNNALASITQSGSVDTSASAAGNVHLLADHGQIKVDGSITANSTGKDDKGQARKGGDIVIGRDEESATLAKSTDVSAARLESQGGFIETSGHNLLADGIRVIAGTWLLDPDNIDITGDATNPIAGYSKIKASDIVGALNQGTSVTVSTTSGATPSTIAYTASHPGDGNIQVSAPIATNVVNGATATLSLVADNGITIASTGGISDAAGNGILNVDLNAKGRATDLGNASMGLKVSGAIDIEGSAKMYAQNSRASGATDTARSAILVNNIAGKSTIKAGSIEMVGASDGLYSPAALQYGSGYGVLFYGSIEATNNIDIAGWTRNNGDAVRIAGGNQIKSFSGNIDILGMIQSTPAAVNVLGTISALNGSVTVTGGSSLKAPGSYFTTISRAEFLTGSSSTGGAVQGIYVNNATIEGVNVTLQSPQSTNAAPQIGVQIQGTSKVNASSSLKIDVQSTSTTSAATRILGTSTLSGATIDIQSDTLELSSTAASTPVTATSSVTIAPRTSSLAVQLGANDTLTSPRVLGLSQSEFDQIAASSLTIGNSTSGNITVASAVSTKDATGNVTLITGGNLAVNAALQTGTTGTKNLTLNLTGSGSATETGSIKTNNLELLGSNASYTLNNTANDATTLAANAKTMSYTDANALSIGSVNSTTGITASGTVSVATQSGNLSVTQAVSTADTSDSAIVLNAGQASAAGTASGGDIQLSGSYSVSTGTGGRTTFYTGNTSNANLTSLVGSGSGRFRYNSNETTANYTAALGSGLYAIYREAPTYNVALNSVTKTYDGQNFSGGNGYVTTGTLLNGDSSAGITGTLAYGGTAQGARNVGSYSITGSGLYSSLGYSLSTTGSTLTVNKAGLTLAGTRTYDGGTTFAGQYLTATGVNGETFAVTGAGDTSNLASKHVTDNQGRTLNSVSGLALGTSSNGGLGDNYNALSTTGSSVTLTKANATVTGTVTNVTYNGSTQNQSAASTSGFIAGDAITISGQASGKNAGTYNSSLAVSGADADNYNVTTSNAGLVIGKANATVTANSATTTYNGQTQSFSGFTASGLVGGETEAVLTGVSTSGGSGRNAGNYTHTASGTDSNYNLSFADGSLTIQKASLKLSALTDTKTYDAGTVSGKAVQISGLQGSDSISNLSQAFDSGNAGTRTLSVNSAYSISDGNGGSNYTVTTNTASGTITPKDVSVTTINANSKAYDGNTTAVVTGVTVSGTAGGETLFASGVGAFDTQNAGTGKTVTVADVTTLSKVNGTGDWANYKLVAAPVSTTADITPKTLSASLTGTVSKTYDSNTNAALAVGNFSLSGFVSGEGASVSQTAGTYASAHVDANGGTGAVTANLLSGHFNANSGTILSNYTLPSSASGNIGTITPAPLTLHVNNTTAFVTQDANTATHNGYSYTGLQGADTASTALVRTPTASDRLYTANTYPTVGTYSGVYGLGYTPVARHGNYSITVQSGQLRVIPADQLLIHVASQSETYGNRSTSSSMAAAVTAQYCLVSTNCNGANLYSLSMASGNGTHWSATDNTNTTIAFDTTMASTGRSSQGGYLNAGNYNWGIANLSSSTSGQFNGYAVNSGVLTINRLSISPTAKAVTKVYDGTRNATGIQLNTPALAGDAVMAMAGDGSYTTKNVVTNDTVTLTNLSLQGIDKDNYVLTASSLQGIGAITPKAASVTGTATNVTYNGQTQYQTAPTSSGFVSGDDISISGAASGKDAGTYTSSLTVSGADAANYSIRVDNADLSIKAAATSAPATVKPMVPPPSSLTHVTYSGFGRMGAAVATSSKPFETRGVRHCHMGMDAAPPELQEAATCSCQTSSTDGVQFCSP